MRARLSKLARRARADGVVATATWALAVAYELYRERRLGISTWRFSPDGLRRDANHGYQPVAYHLIDRALKHVAVRAGRDVFLDYGCGKGRVLAVAALRPFKSVIGVELDDAHHADAVGNLARAKPRLRCRDVQLLHVDATTYEVPDDVSVIFMFNPFRGHVMEAVKARIAESLARAPRALTVLYVYPHDLGDLLADFAPLALETHLPTGSWDTMRLAVYRSASS